MKELLNDTTKFERLEIAPDKHFNFVINSQAKIKNILKRIPDKESLADMLHKKALPVRCCHGILNDQAKVHRPAIYNCPSFRPLLDAITTPLYKLAKFLVPILSPLTMNKYPVKDSFALAKEITKADCNYIMASLDVESLFTNVALEETIENCINILFFDKCKIDNLTKQDVYDLLSAAAKESIFIFDNTLYCQIDGLAMESLL